MIPSLDSGEAPWVVSSAVGGACSVVGAGRCLRTLSFLLYNLFFEISSYLIIFWNKIVYGIWSGEKENKRIWGRNDKGCVWKIDYVKKIKDYIVTVDERQPMICFFYC